MSRLTGLTLCLALFVNAASADEGFKPLFNGQNLEGWIQRGGKAKYRVEGDAIVGESVPNTSNSFLCTEKDFANFEFEVEFKVDPDLNSGIQIRSECFDEAKKLKLKQDGEEKEINVGAGRVHGYQVEIDPKERAWSGGIYDEGRRGWLFNLEKNEPARKAFKPNEWNRFRIVANGPSIKTWINDVPAADLTDDVTPKGFIALQVHGVGSREEPLQVQWRKIRIKELP
jgi:hypothetical protein